MNFLTFISDAGYFSMAIIALVMAASGLMEGFIGVKTIDGMTKNPEMYGKLRTGMIVADALTETTAIYALLLALLILFVGG